MRWRVAAVAGVTAMCLAKYPAQAKEKKAAVDEVRVAGAHLEQTSRCNKGGVIRVMASDSRLLIGGDCTDVVITGDRNWIQVEHAVMIRMGGEMNTVVFEDPGTQVEDRGRANSVTPKWPQ